MCLKEKISRVSLGMLNPMLKVKSLHSIYIVLHISFPMDMKNMNIEVPLLEQYN